MTTADYDRLSHVIGETVIDREGNRVGKVTQIACEPDTLEPEWLVVKTSLFGRPRLVPLDRIEEDGDVVWVPFPKASVLEAPVPAIPTTPASSERQALLSHYATAA